MFLKAYTELPLGFEVVRAAMLERPEAWLGDLGAVAQSQGERLLVDVGLEVAGRPFERTADLEVGTGEATDRVVSLPIRLRMRGDGRLFPQFEGSLDAAWLGPHRTQLALLAVYDPPLGSFGRVVDRALLHRVAESVAGRFLEAAASRLVGS